jgi:oxygen-independent coproporphyrinogen III oxidase
MYAQNYRDLKDYYAAIDRNELPTMRGILLNDDDVIRRAAIGKLLCHCIIQKKEFESEFGICFDEYFSEELSRLASLHKDGLVSLTADAISVTMLGRIFIRNAGMVFDRYLQKPKNKPVFSKTL